MNPVEQMVRNVEFALLLSDIVRKLRAPKNAKISPSAELSPPDGKTYQSKTKTQQNGNLAKTTDMEPIQLHNTPGFYVEYVKNWLAQMKKQNRTAAELAIVEDISIMLGIAAGVMSPVSGEKDMN